MKIQVKETKTEELHTLGAGDVFTFDNCVYILMQDVHYSRYVGMNVMNGTKCEFSSNDDVVPFPNATIVLDGLEK